MQKRRDTLSKSERLSSERRIEALFTGGRRGGVEPLRFCWMATPVELKSGEQADAHPATAHPSTEAGGNEFSPRGLKPQELPEPGVSVLFSVPKKSFKRAWKRNLLKRRMRESYRQRKHDLAAAAAAAGQHIEIALICAPAIPKEANRASTAKTSKGLKAAPAAKGAKAAKRAANPQPEIPDFKTIDNAIAKILAKILDRS